MYGKEKETFSTLPSLAKTSYKKLDESKNQSVLSFTNGGLTADDIPQSKPFSMEHSFNQNYSVGPRLNMKPKLKDLMSTNLAQGLVRQSKREYGKLNSQYNDERKVP